MNYADVFSDQPLNEHVQDYNKKMGDNQNKGGKYPVYLSLGAGEESLVRFLEKEPIKFWQHRVYDPTIKNGQGGFRVLSCTRTPDCPLCLAGDKPLFKVAWQVIHMDNLDAESGQVKPRIKLWVQGIRFGELYERKSSRFDPSKMNVILERIGVGQNTQYSMEKADNQDAPQYDTEEITNLMEYFGLDDDKYKDMQRIAASISANPSANQDKGFQNLGTPAPAENTNYSGPKQGSKSLLEGDEDIPF